MTAIFQFGFAQVSVNQVRISSGPYVVSIEDENRILVLISVSFPVLISSSSGNPSRLWRPTVVRAGSPHSSSQAISGNAHTY